MTVNLFWIDRFSPIGFVQHPFWESSRQPKLANPDRESGFRKIWRAVFKLYFRRDRNSGRDSAFASPGCAKNADLSNWLTIWRRRNRDVPSSPETTISDRVFCAGSRLGSAPIRPAPDSVCWATVSFGRTPEGRH
jgi:hypothetical protein